MLLNLHEQIISFNSRTIPLKCLVMTSGDVGRVGKAKRSCLFACIVTACMNTHRCAVCFFTHSGGRDDDAQSQFSLDPVCQVLNLPALAAPAAQAHLFLLLLLLLSLFSFHVLSASPSFTPPTPRTWASPTAALPCFSVSVLSQVSYWLCPRCK